MAGAELVSENAAGAAHHLPLALLAPALHGRLTRPAGALLSAGYLVFLITQLTH